jgi:ribose 5-phosphate isomerase B
MIVALGADHAGFALKEALKPMLDARGVAWRDFGTGSTSAVDYPDYASPVAHAVARGEVDRGILVCGSGVGMAIAANKVPGIRAAPSGDAAGAALAREHNDVNVLTLAGRQLTPDAAAGIVDAFLSTPFAGGRHQRRIAKIHQLEHDPTATPRA